MRFVRHAADAVSISVIWNDGISLLTVRDWGPGFEAATILESDVLHDHGRGRSIIRKLAVSFLLRRIPTSGTEIQVVLPLRHRSISLDCQINI